jgi:hypothetical protein
MEMSPVRKMLVWYNLLRNPQTRPTKLQIDLDRLDIYILVSAGLGGVLLPLLDDHGLEVLALGHLGLDLCDQLRQVWGVLLLCQCLVIGGLTAFLHPRAWSIPP